ncbi:NAD(P)/FAD-dependent oxidoreductase [Garciella nitratireducens]|uniref:NAD(P)/FAD-dependent oxidoreductase n=1 Tax=Garciella nitratireducens TaxID=218205 RepID=UPI001BD1BDD0|nr:NAD(P)/FAD-dependent oxidoreductase [Garciella nitratireducens]
MYDVIIIGKGPAGIQAALYTARANLNTLILGKESPLRKSAKIDNYFGQKSISGTKLLETGLQQIQSVGAKCKEELVLNLTKEKNLFKIITDQNKYESKSVIIATGQPSQKIFIKNMERFEGMGIHYCTTCDGFFYRDAKIGMLGYTDYVIEETKEMLTFTKNIVLLTHGKELTINENARNFIKEKSIPVITKKILSFQGTNALETVQFEDGSIEKFDGIFIAYGSASSVDFARKLGVAIKDNTLDVDKYQKTNIDGLFAAGDCTGGFKQISTAVGEGALAAKSAIEYIKNKKD